MNFRIDVCVRGGSVSLDILWIVCVWMHAGRLIDVWIGSLTRTLFRLVSDTPIIHSHVTIPSIQFPYPI